MKKANNSTESSQGLTPKSEGRQFLVLAGVILPILLVAGVAAYGFIVWMLQLFFFGPPS